MARRRTNQELTIEKASQSQDDISRQRRLNNGCCPYHGVQLGHVTVDMRNIGQGRTTYAHCPVEGCKFQQYKVRRGSKMEDALGVF